MKIGVDGMKILVCFKVSHDMEGLTDGEWKQMAEQGIDFSYIRKEISCFDEAALELGLRLADQIRETQSVELTAMTAGTELESHFVKSLYAVRYDRVCLVKTDEEISFDPRKAAGLIRNFMRADGGYDVVIMGQRSSEGGHGQTHWMLSELEGIPAFTHVRDVNYEDGCFYVENSDERYRYIHKIDGNLILGVENAAHPYLRTATLREKMQVSGKQEEIVDAAYDAGSTVPVRLEKEIEGRSCRMIEGDGPAEKAAVLYREYMSELLEDSEGTI